MIKEMLSVLMDGLKDANMMLGYVYDSQSENHPEWTEWFKTKVRKRIEAIDSDYDYIMRISEMNQRIAQGDEIACALKEYLDGQVLALKNEFASI